MDAGELLLRCSLRRCSQFFAMTAMALLPEAGAQSCQSPEPPCRRHMPWTRNSAHCTSGRSVVAGAGSKQRGEESENSGTSTTDKRAAGMMALHNVGQWVFAPPPHQPRVFRSTYTWARLEPKIGQSNSWAAIIAPRRMQWEALFHSVTENSHRKT